MMRVVVFGSRYASLKSTWEGSKFLPGNDIYRTDRVRRASDGKIFYRTGNRNWFTVIDGYVNCARQYSILENQMEHIGREFRGADRMENFLCEAIMAGYVKQSDSSKIDNYLHVMVREIPGVIK